MGFCAMRYALCAMPGFFSLLSALTRPLHLHSRHKPLFALRLEQMALLSATIGALSKNGG
jgi:hypothetical protein